MAGRTVNPEDHKDRMADVNCFLHIGFQGLSEKLMDRLALSSRREGRVGIAYSQSVIARAFQLHSHCWRRACERSHFQRCLKDLMCTMGRLIAVLFLTGLNARVKV